MNNTNTSKSENQKTIVIYMANVARKLLKDGFRMVDIKPDHNDPDRKKSVFIFELNDELLAKLDDYKVNKDNNNKYISC